MGEDEEEAMLHHGGVYSVLHHGGVLEYGDAPPPHMLGSGFSAI